MTKPNIKDYQLLEQVGSGSFATVYKARHKQTKQLFAIKRMKEMPRNDQIVVNNQIQLLKRIKHPNIIHYETDFKEKGKWYIVFQFCGKGDLQHFRQKNGKIPQQFAKNVFYNIIDAVAVLHENKIVHRDLKLANVLINDKFQIKLADFGFSKDNQSGLMSSVCGTPLTMAPQILQRQPYDERCDTWSLGVLLYQLIYNKPPFFPSKEYGPGIIGLTNAVLKAKPVFDQQIQISSECKDVILKCLEKKMKNRPTVIKLKNHPWFNQGVRSTIRRGFFVQKSISEDQSEAVLKCKAVLNQVAHQSLKRALQAINLTDSGIKQMLKSLFSNYPQNEKIQVIYLLKTAKSLNEISSSFIKINIQGKKFQIKLDEVSKFKQHKEHLKEFLNKQIKCRKSQYKKSTNLQKEIVRFVASNAYSCLGIEEINAEKAQLISKLSDLCINDIQSTKVGVNWCFKGQFESMRNQFDKYLQKLNDNKVVELINGIDEQVCDDEVKQNWLIQYDFEYKVKNGLQFFLGDILSKVIKINKYDEIVPYQ